MARYQLQSERAGTGTERVDGGAAGRGVGKECTSIVRQLSARCCCCS